MPFRREPVAAAPPDPDQGLGFFLEWGILQEHVLFPVNRPTFPQESPLKGIHSALLAATLLVSLECKRKDQEITHVVQPASQPSVPGAPPAAAEVAPAKAPLANLPDDPASHKNRKVIGENKLKKHWRGIRIKIVDVPNRREALWDVKPGRPVPFPGLGLSMKVKHILADFAMGKGVVRAVSDEERNPAAEVQVFEGDKLVWEGWIFKKAPDLRQYRGNRYNLVLVDILPAR